MVVWRNNALLTDSLKRFSNSNKSSKSIKESSKKVFSVLQRRGAQISIKPCSVAENQAKKGGGQLGHQGVGRQVFRAEEAAEVRISEVLLENCPKCECRLLSQTSNERAIYDLQREEIRQIYYEIRRKRCPKCRKTYAGKVANAKANAKLSNDLIVEVGEQHYVLGRAFRTNFRAI